MNGNAAVASLPGTIRVGPYDFRIEQWDHVTSTEHRCWGECSILMQTIRICSHMPTPFKAVDTFLHELGHAIFWAYALEDEDKEERLIATQARAWTQIYRDNAWLPAWISKALHP